MISRRILLGAAASATMAIPDASPARAAVARGQPAPRPRTGTHGELPLVFIDPGHGGKDPGAIGATGTFEKHVALAAARELARRLQAGGRYRVALSRASDVFVPLERRVETARARGAALFMSIHADALGDHAVRGASVYTLAEQASDPQSAALARRENAADRFAGPGFASLGPDVARILASLVRQETRGGSARLARSVVDCLQRDLTLLPNPARHAGFVVLKAADIPSVLVEMGFMSNQGDEAALRQGKHRAIVAAALHRAVDGYFASGGAARRLAG